MTQSESIAALTKGLIAAQAEFGSLPKDKNGYGYKYTDLDTVIKYVRPILAKNGIGFMQTLTSTQNGRYAVITRLFAVDGEYIEDSVILPDFSMKSTNAIQNLGAATTYIKRYALCAMLGISSDEDVDAVMFDRACNQQQQQQYQQRNNQQSQQHQYQQRNNQQQQYQQQQQQQQQQRNNQQQQQAQQASGNNQQQQQQTAAQDKQLLFKDRPATDKEKTELRTLLQSKRQDGTAYFSAYDMQELCSHSKDYDYEHFKSYIETEILKR